MHVTAGRLTGHGRLLTFPKRSSGYRDQRGGGENVTSPITRLRAPLLFNLRADPYEFGTVTSNAYNDWMFRRAYLVYAVQAVAAKFAETFRDFPVVQKPNTFTIDDAMAKMSEAAAGNS